MSKTILLRCLIVSLLALFCGCNTPHETAKTYPVQGTVKFKNGTPVRTGKIEFLSDDGQWTATGEIDEDGHFTLGTNDGADGAVLGKHKIMITQVFIPGHPTMSLETAGPPVASIYNSFGTSPLTIEVEDASVNRLTIELVSEP